jgi:enoyl-CoA hydratase/carnithine racemase
VQSFKRNDVRINLSIYGFSWNNDQQSGISNEQESIVANVHGFGSISRRTLNKPIIAAVHGGAYGGGMEILLNCDIVVAADDAKFALPEVKRGVTAIQGGKL